MNSFSTASLLAPERKTVGAQIAEHNAKNIQFEDDVREYSLVMGRKVLENLYAFAQETSKRTQFKNKDFYVVLVINHDRVLHEPKFIIKPARFSCPTPVYKDTVYKYHHLSGDLEYLWHIPSQGKCQHIMKNLQSYFANKETKRLAQFVYSFESGELLQWVKKENNEEPDKPNVIISHTPNQG